MPLRSIAGLGEVMVELRPLHRGERHYGIGFAGDTFNTMVGLARHGICAGYMTMLGSDRFSNEMIALAEREHIDASAVLRSQKSLPGLYLIANDDSGEREFHYWRQSSSARELLVTRSQLEQVQGFLERFDAVYISGISAAVIGLAAERNFWELIERLKQRGKQLLFDPNYRPQLWPDVATAAAWCERIASYCDWVFPTFADESLLWNLPDEDAVVEHYLDLGVDEVVLKCPGAVAMARRGSEHHRLESQYDGPVIDTTGAGDAFNAGYIAARIQGLGLAAALAAGHEAAARVISVAGAFPPAEGDADSDG